MTRVGSDPGPTSMSRGWQNATQADVPVTRSTVGAVDEKRSTGPSARPAVVVDGLTKRFAARVAFEDVSFQVGYGEVFGFLGPNGAGKTTTVRTLGTLIAPTSGSATIAGIPLNDENGPAIRARISILPESPGLYLRLSGGGEPRVFRQAVRAGPCPRAGSGRTRSGQAERSGRRSVRLAVQGPPPTGGPGPRPSQRPGRVVPRRAHLRSRSGGGPRGPRAHRLARGRGVTIFLTTHRLEEAERLCHRVAILNTTLRLIGRPDELRQRLFTRSAAGADPGCPRQPRPPVQRACPVWRDGRRRRRAAID